MKSEIGEKVVPIIPDEGRTFGMDPLFSEFGIYSSFGQLYTPVDHKMLMKLQGIDKRTDSRGRYLRS